MPATENQAKFEIFLKPKEIVAWLSEFKVEGTQSHVFLGSVPLLERVSQQNLPYSLGLDTRGEGSAEIRRHDDSESWALAVLSYMKTRKG